MPGRKSGRYSSLSSQREGEAATIRSVTPELLGELVIEVVAIGDAVLIGQTRDGTAVRIILMSGDEKTSEYLATAPDVDDFCKRVSEHLRNTFT